MALPQQLTAQSVDRWAQQLPLTNKAVVAQEAFELLQWLRREAIEIETRGRILSTLERPVTLVLGHLLTQVGSGHGKTELFLNLGRRFSATMAECWQEVYHHRSLTAAKRWRAGNSELRHARAQTAQYLSRCQLLHTVDYRRPPRGLWRQINALFVGAGKHELAPLHRMVAFHLADAHALSQVDQMTLDQLLSTLSSKQLLRSQTAHPRRGAVAESGFYLPGDDQPPRFGTVPAGATRIDPGPALHQLEAARRSEHRSLLDHLRRTWRPLRPERSPRVTTRQSLHTDAVIGLRSVMRFLGDNGEQQAPAADVRYQTLFEQVSNQFNRAPRIDATTVVDAGASGCRLRGNWPQVQPGEIVALRWARQEWRIGAVVWIGKGEQEQSLGIRWLLLRPHAVTLTTTTGDTIDALRGLDAGGSADVVLYQPQSHDQLTECRLATGSGEPAARFRLRTTRKSGTARLAEASPITEVPAAAPTPRAIPEAAPTAIRPDANEPVTTEPITTAPATTTERAFDDVWQSLGAARTRRSTE